MSFNFNFLKRFFTHQLGYVYRIAGHTLKQNEGELVAIVQQYAPQGIEAVAKALANAAGHLGVAGMFFASMIAAAAQSLDAEAQALLSSNAPAFLDAVAAKLEAHAVELLAA